MPKYAVALATQSIVALYFFDTTAERSQTPVLKYFYENQMIGNQPPFPQLHLPLLLPPEIDPPSLIHGANKLMPLAAITFGVGTLYELLRRYWAATSLALDKVGG